MREKFCEKYFDNKVKPKHLREFCEKTPKGNTIKGFVCRKSNEFLGSLIITHITEKSGKSYDTEQFVHAFPKIHYWDDRHKLKEDEESIVYCCGEKLDGTCLILYSLNDDFGQSIEIVPKTRSKAVADDHIVEMYNLIDKKAIEKFFSDPVHLNDSLMFELYGILNRHEIAYMNTYIDIKLIGAYVDDIFLDYIGIKYYYDLEDFSKPDILFSIEKYACENSFLVKWQGHKTRLRNYEVSSQDSFPSLYDAIQEIKLLMEQINKEYIKNNGRRAIEGVVINGKHFNNGQMYLKIKPHDIEEEAKRLDSVPRRFILKEVNKYFDEFGSKVRDIYMADETHYIKYVKLQLQEEFTFEQIEDPRTRRRIKSVFMDVWDSKIPPVSLQNICEELVLKNPDASVTDLMKIFAATYPSKKKQSRFVYNILSKIVKK